MRPRLLSIGPKLGQRVAFVCRSISFKEEAIMGRNMGIVQFHIENKTMLAIMCHTCLAYIKTTCARFDFHGDVSDIVWPLVN
mmetsp:Transcript_30447/g.64478  ORF Transcript_30447/g.64478 Transcript_30447/m.64478 type:complete len:82 (+) Transcript_30447:741-986(+)